MLAVTEIDCVDPMTGVAIVCRLSVHGDDKRLAVLLGRFNRVFAEHVRNVRRQSLAEDNLDLGGDLVLVDVGNLLRVHVAANVLVDDVLNRRVAPVIDAKQFTLAHLVPFALRLREKQ